MVGRDIWDVEAASSSLATPTINPHWQAVFGCQCGFLLHYILLRCLLFKPFLVSLYSSLDLFDHGVELLLTFFVGLGVYVVGFALSMGICRSVPSFKQMIINLVDTTGSRSSAFSFIRLVGCDSFFLLWSRQLCFSFLVGVTIPDLTLNLFSRCFFPRYYDLC